MYKNLKMEFKKTDKIWHIYSLRFNHWLAHRDMKEALRKLTKAIKLKSSV